MEMVRLHIVGMSLFMETKILLILQTLGNNMAPMKICPGGVHGGLHWPPAYYQSIHTQRYIVSNAYLHIYKQMISIEYTLRYKNEFLKIVSYFYQRYNYCFRFIRCICY